MYQQQYQIWKPPLINNVDYFIRVLQDFIFEFCIVKTLIHLYFTDTVFPRREPTWYFSKMVFRISVLLLVLINQQSRYFIHRVSTVNRINFFMIKIQDIQFSMDILILDQGQSFTTASLHLLSLPQASSIFLYWKRTPSSNVKKMRAGKWQYHYLLLNTESYSSKENY